MPKKHDLHMGTSNKTSNFIIKLNIISIFRISKNIPEMQNQQHLP